MSIESTPVDNRPGNTMKEVEGFLLDHPDDPYCKSMATAIERIVNGWGRGEHTQASAMHCLVDTYRDVEGVVSEEASTMLYQATMWFGYEAGVEPGSELDEQILTRLHGGA